MRYCAAGERPDGDSVPAAAVPVRQSVGEPEPSGRAERAQAAGPHSRPVPGPELQAASAAAHRRRRPALGRPPQVGAGTAEAARAGERRQGFPHRARSRVLHVRAHPGRTVHLPQGRHAAGRGRAPPAGGRKGIGRRRLREDVRGGRQAVPGGLGEGRGQHRRGRRRADPHREQLRGGRLVVPRHLRAAPAQGSADRRGQGVLRPGRLDQVDGHRRRHGRPHPGRDRRRTRLPGRFDQACRRGRSAAGQDRRDHARGRDRRPAQHRERLGGRGQGRAEVRGRVHRLHRVSDRRRQQRLAGRHERVLPVDLGHHRLGPQLEAGRRLHGPGGHRRPGLAHQSLGGAVRPPPHHRRPEEDRRRDEDGVPRRGDRRGEVPQDHRAPGHRGGQGDGQGSDARRLQLGRVHQARRHRDVRQGGRRLPVAHGQVRCRQGGGGLPQGVPRAGGQAQGTRTRAARGVAERSDVCGGGGARGGVRRPLARRLQERAQVEHAGGRGPRGLQGRSRLDGVDAELAHRHQARRPDGRAVGAAAAGRAEEAAPPRNGLALRPAHGRGGVDLHRSGVRAEDDAVQHRPELQADQRVDSRAEGKGTR
ncbi:putative Copper resistance protein CopD / Cytochrome c oxidase caa3-type assembly factor CtaG_BS (Unrelated to Cox11-CtaG family) [Streptomyces misionensis JCM 4497]